MADYGISFQDNMMLEIINGTKTRTSRIAKGQPPKCRYKKGDILWCREAWRIVWGLADLCEIGVGYKTGIWCYRDWCKVSRNTFSRYYRSPNNDVHRWRSSRHMPRWASRVELRVLDVQLVQIAYITTEQIIAEGITSGSREEFQTLWDSINKKSGYSWASNPWVFGVDFKIINKEGRSDEENGS